MGVPGRASQRAYISEGVHLTGYGFLIDLFLIGVHFTECAPHRRSLELQMFPAEVYLHPTFTHSACLGAQ
jgi:hypothetical protein